MTAIVESLQKKKEIKGKGNWRRRKAREREELWRQKYEYITLSFKL